tara:strand:- start:227 stop:421 length:195 start_codon:yes stop_codon:yes gene_type:complete
MYYAEQNLRYYKENMVAKNRHDTTRRIVQRAGMFQYHDDLKRRIASGEVDPNVFLERDVLKRGK